MRDDMLPVPGPSYLVSLAERRSVERIVCERLLAEHVPALSAGLVLRTVLRCSRDLRRSGVEHGVEAALEAMARHRLLSLEATG